MNKGIIEIDKLPFVKKHKKELLKIVWINMKEIKDELWEI